ncbi:MAG: multidrug efflux RND transporter permease subunit [Hyphomicrobiaceae bacterium]|nr:multidrug efflux RND transporter permease subunit [Hyphomicrobiaceae bacterium]
MRMSRFFIDRPIFAAVLAIVTTVVGFIAYLTLPVSQFPEIVPPTVSISASYPGASADVVADTVAAVIEQEVNGVEGMIYMSSQSTGDGSISISVTFDLGVDIDRATVLVQNRVAAATPRLPEEVQRSGITVRKNSPDLLLVVHLLSPSKTYDTTYISNYTLLNVVDEIARIEGVGSTALFGSREYSMRVWLDPEQIAARGMTAEDVIQGLRAANVQVAGGAVGQPPMEETGAFQTSLRVKGRLAGPEEFNNIVIKTGADGRVVKLRDIGRVELGALSYSTYGYLSKDPAIVMIVNQQPGSNAVRTTNAVKQAMARLSERFPKGLEYRIEYNPTEFIEVSIAALYLTILEAVLLVVAVVLLFLQSWRASIIPLLAIPVSLIGTFAVMAGLGYSINMLTLFGLVLAVGIVVDDAIVVVENVERKLASGMSPIDASRATMDEVGTALVAIAVVLSAVFIPTAFVGGITGQFYKQFAVTVATATIISAFNSLTLSPALAAILLRPHVGHGQPGARSWNPLTLFFQGFNAAFDWLEHAYSRLVRGLIAFTPLVLLVYAALIGLAVWMLTTTPTGFIPKMDRGILIVSAQLPDGASLSRTDDVVRRATGIILETPGAKAVSAYSGRSGATFTNATNAGALFVILDDAAVRAKKGLTAEAIANTLRASLARIEEASTFVFIPPPVRGMGGQTGFSMRLQNRANLTPDEFATLAREFVQAANTAPGIANTFTTFATATPQFFIDVDRDKAQILNVPLPAINEALRVFMGSAYINDFNMFGRTFRVTAQAEGDFRLDPDNIARIKVRSTRGDMVALGNVITVRQISGPDRVPRYNLYPSIEINGATKPGVSSGQALATMAELANQRLPEGVTYEWTDLSYQEAKAGRAAYLIFALSVMFVFLALAAQFESWSLPLAIQLIVPMCLLSALFGVRLHGQDINIMTQVAFVVLIGLAAKNAVLIVEFAKQLEERGRTAIEAAVEASRLRLRPIIMTSLAFTLGVVPLYVAIGAGAELRVALGTAVFWGMIGVTIFGLLFTPVFYVVVRRLFPGHLGLRSDAPAATSAPLPAASPAE